MINLDGKTVLVTGAAGGIGIATGRKILETGGNVVLHYHSAAREIPDLITEYGEERAMSVCADLSKTADIDRLFEEACTLTGKLDAIVNNAAVIQDVTVEDDIDTWRKHWKYMMDVNVQAMADLCYHGIHHFRKHGGGAFVNIASRAGFRGDQPDSMHYAASKGGVVALTRSLAKGFARENILAYTVAPGWVMTERVRPTLEKPENAFMINEIPMGAPAPAEELGNLIAFILSGSVTHATGATFDVNGASYFH